MSPCLGLKPRSRSKQMPRASASQCFRAYSGATFRLSVLAFSISALAPGDVSQLSTTRTTGSRISNLRKDYVESHLSPHFSLTIAYSSPPEPGRCDFAQERPANSGTTKNESIESLRDLSLAGRRAFRDWPMSEVNGQLEPRLRKRNVRDVVWRYLPDRRFQVDHAKIIWPNWLPRVLWFHHVCPCCESVHFKPSEAHSLDLICSLFALRPIRCTFCWRHYYWFSIRSME